MRKMKKRYSSSPFGAMQNAAVGIAGLGVVSVVGAGIQANAPAGSPNMMGGFNTLAGFVPIATTAVIAKSLLPKQKKSKYGF